MRPARLLVRAGPALLGLAVLILVLVVVQKPGPLTDTSNDIAQLLAAVRNGDANAHAAMLDVAAEGRAEVAPHLPAMLNDDEPRLRLLACSWIGARRDRQWLGMIIVRAGDSDWRVRSAAFHALDRFAPITPMPLRDTPLAQREAALLDWLDRFDAQADPPLAPDLCEFYADLSHVEVGQGLVQRCLQCHAGPVATRGFDSARCVTCHDAAHAQWTASSHAQSLSHVQLTTVNAQTRQVEPMTFGGLRGITCAACHGMPDSADDREVELCVLRDPSAGAADACAYCHASTEQQWRTWQSSAQPRAAQWPPGAVEITAAADTRTCTDCHMPLHWHRLTVRRDPELLRQGVALSVRPVQRQARRTFAPLVLTNLAGHDFPTGTRRRAVRVLVRFDDDDEQLTVSLVPNRLPAVDANVAAALAPGEQRGWDLDVPPGASRLTVRLVYVRNRFDPQCPTIEIAATQRPIDHMYP